MAYKCVHCSEVYKDGANEVLTGCTKCHSKFFFYIKEEKLKEIEANKSLESDLNLDNTEKRQMEKDVREIAGVTDEETPVLLDFESIKVIRPGKYVLDLPKLFSQGKPRVYKLEDGKYIVDLSSVIKLENNKE